MTINYDTEWKPVQKAVGVKEDGYAGPNTIKAIKRALGIEDAPTRPSGSYKAEIVSQTQIRSGKSAFGKAGDESYLTNVPVPANYPLTYDGKPVKTIRIHKLISDRVETALKEIGDFYEKKFGNVTEAKEKAPGIYLYGGSYNNRSISSGGVKSIHSWGLALDFDSGQNWYNRTKKAGARLAQDVYTPFFDIWEKHGFYSLGRKSDQDWMHIQAASWS